ncbi:MAG: hypothetical protein LUC34_08250 [Campylobacter sp.]|nr:hypothetical protein [Campylobacter sp.]
MNDNNISKAVTDTIGNTGAAIDGAWGKFIENQEDIGKASNSIVGRAVKPVGIINDINNYTLAKTEKEEFQEEYKIAASDIN